MKHSFIYITLLFFTALSLGSCKKFLKESSPDEIRPTTTQDLYSLMIGSAYPYQTVADYYLDMLTDEIKCNGLPNATYASYLTNSVLLYTWNPAMFDRNEAGLLSDQDSWQIYYKLINGCNLIKDYVNKVTGTEKEKNAMLGQVLFLRAYYYFKLVNIYGQPYNGNGIDPTTAPGVPLILSSVVSDERKTRNTLAEVYAQIESDLLQAADLLKNNYAPDNAFRVSHYAAYALLSRLYLYRSAGDDLDKSIQYATEVINAKPLTLLKSYFSATNVFSTAGIYDVNASQEVIWVYGSNSTNIALYIPPVNFTNLTPPFSISDELSNLYDKGTGSTDQGDLRFVSYFAKYINASVRYPLRSAKIGSTQVYGDKGLRVAEMYLNRAEAAILRYKANNQAADFTQALTDLNALRLSRYDTRNVGYTPVNAPTVDSLWNFYQKERRRELCLEDGHRWFDIKRWATPITHTFIDANAQATTYTLGANSLIYALPIPYTATENNFKLAQNPR
ncbi:RagB/SusD family nutrient uptake outer membrane protein [Niastella caeni]|uniref:RagB/SusD family nutrient uptake outer membrane protein n=1 Tax=Niastella caeni TaxID=2569763 RepID=A0A4S8I2M5_9BACT|nr:RagB/SusD family nutrient uptake outer membrane protein [Niastella caeni]THU40152.1 RagB/SusD family nutrient uptake outer membrane protein [Niastella caeni]